jgi:integrase
MGNYQHQRFKLLSPEEFQTLLKGCHYVFQQALLSVLYYWGLRISEALALTGKDVILEPDRIYLKVKRLKHSAQTAPVPVPRDRPGLQALDTLASAAQINNQPLFAMSRKTAWKLCRTFHLYPHFFRMNRITQDSQWGVAYVKRRIGISARAIDYYIGTMELEAHVEEIH